MAQATEASPELAELAHEIAGLRRELASLREERAAGARLRLTAARSGSLLGQRIAVSVEAVDGRGAPLAGRSITFAATAGGLRAAGRTALRAPAAAAVVLATGEDGFARAELVHGIDAALGPDERAALEVALAPFAAAIGARDRFDPASKAAAEALTELARQYRLHGNITLQSAVDACFRAADAPRADTAGGGPWRTSPLALLGQLSDAAADEPSAVAAGAVLALTFFDWRGPFLAAVRAQAEAESTLPGQLLAEREGSAVEELPGRLYDRVRRFVADQRGEVGQALARSHAEAALVGFLDRGARDLPPEKLQILMPALVLGSSALASGTTSTLAVVAQTRTDLRRDIVVRPPLVNVNTLFDRVGVVEATIVDLVDHGTLDEAIGGIRGDLAVQLEAETKARLDLSRQLDTRTSSLSASLAEERTARLELARQIEVHRTFVDGGLVDVKAQVATETAARNDLSVKLAAETAARNDLAVKMAAETAARNDLAAKLTAETAARKDLATKLTAETAARNDLAAKLTAETAARNDLAVKLQAEIAARTELAIKLQAETAARTELAVKLEAETAARTELTVKLEAETTARNDLAVKLEAETAARTKLELRTDATNDQVTSIKTSIRRIDTDIANLKARPRPIG